MIFWAICISWSAAFLAVVSIYLYTASRKNRMKNDQTIAGRPRLARDFVFVWILLSLLVLYIVSIDRGSSILFAAGNIIVEAALIAYTVKSGK